MELLKSLLLALALSNARFCNAYRILGIFPFSAKSHFIMFEQLMKGLARRGHQVDVASLYPLKQPFPNYTDIIKFSSPVGYLTNNVTLQEIENSPVLDFIATEAGNELCDQLGNPQILDLVRNPPKDPPYDLFITEIFGAHRCFLAIGHVLKVPVIGVASAALYPWMNDMIANPENLAWVPNTLIDNVNEAMLVSSFWWRLYNTINTAYLKWRFEYLTKPQDDIIRKYFGPGMPSARELESTLSLIFVNSHTSLTNVKPITPALIEIAGLHIQDDDSELPLELKKWLDEAEFGFVYVSFGSILKIESFPEKTLAGFLRSLGKIAPVRVLLKITNSREIPAEIPENILTLTWTPQIKILQHQKIRAFITHGGLMGVEEAIYFGVPMIGIPLFADQFYNIANCVQKKIAIRFDMIRFSEKHLDDALDEVLHNPVYKNSIQIVSEKFRDRPQNPLDTACYWSEYVIRRGGETLKSPALDLMWWQVALLDVYGFLFLCSIVFLYLGQIVIRKLAYIFSYSKL